MAKIKITPGDWRWRIAQGVLKVLYQRKRDLYIAPWKNAGIGTGALMTHKGKILLGQRRGNIEDAGCWGILGGFLDMERKEKPAEALCREIWEEAGLMLKPDQFPVESLFTARLSHGRDMLELADYSICGLFYRYELSQREVEALQPSDEMHNFTLFTPQEIEQLYAEDKLHRSSDMQAALWSLMHQLQAET